MAPRPEYKPGLLPVGRPSKNIMQQRYIAQGCFFDPDVVSDDDIKEIVKRAVADAKDGNAQARDFVAAYRFGRPKPMDEGGITINIEGDGTKIALLSDEALELLISLGHDPVAIDDDATPNADRAIDAEYRTLPAPPGSDH